MPPTYFNVKMTYPTENRGAFALGVRCFPPGEHLLDLAADRTEQPVDQRHAIS